MTDVQIEVPLFWDRLNRFYKSWREEAATWQNADAIVSHVGLPNDSVIYSKSVALQQWFFGYEFTETIIVFCDKIVYVYASEKKVRILETVVKKLEGVPFLQIEFMVRQKDEGTENLQRLVDAIKGSKQGKKLGRIVKDQQNGASAVNWNKFVAESGIETVDISLGISSVLLKDATEQKNIKTAATIAAHVLKSHLLLKVETVIDEEGKQTHMQIAADMDKIFSDPSKISQKLDPEHIDSCYTPIIMSGGNYDVKPGQDNNNDPLHFGIICCAVGAKYKSYCSNIMRTYLVDPSKEHEQQYKFLLEVYQVVLDKLRVKTKISDVYNAAVDLITKRDKKLLEHFGSTAGHGIGLEFCESDLLINSSNTAPIKAGMVFNISVAFNNLSSTSADPKKRKYSLMIADTVAVKETGIEILTDKCPKKYSDISYFLENERAQEAPEPKKVKEPPTQIIEAKLRSRTTQREEEKTKMVNQEQKRKEHQKMLEERAKEEAAARFSKDKKPKQSTTKRTVASMEAYKDPSQYPPDLERNKIKIDTARECVLIPMFGVHVPFLISTIKNESKYDEQFLRINFNAPENYNPQETDDPSKRMPIHLKELVYKCSDAQSLNALDRGIKELRKKVTARENERREVATLVTQEKLVLSRQRVPRLSDLFVRPNPAKGKTNGALEAHTNGFRFQANKGENIDVMYKNIRHAFFQPAENELIVLVHFHLHNGIMIGKKKVSDVQFATEVMEVSQAIDSRDDDEDPLRERQLRNKLNREFSEFVRKVEDQIQGLEFDLPFRDLGFDGVPGRSGMFLQPTVNCLVSLSEQPFFVLTLADVEIASFERVQFSLRNFDVIFVLKDYEKLPVHVNSVSAQHLATIKEWLDSRDIKYYENPQPLNWGRIMQEVRDDPVKFHTTSGGWSFLKKENGSSDEGSSSDEEEEDFDPSEDEEGGGSDEEEQYSEDSDSEEGSDEEAGSEEGESEEDDWDALEAKAKQDDMRATQKRGRDFSDDEEDSRKKKSKSSAGGKATVQTKLPTSSKPSSGKPGGFKPPGRR